MAAIDITVLTLTSMWYFRQKPHKYGYKNTYFDDLLLAIKQLMIAKLSFVLNCLRDTSFVVK